mmetsp:Transcript_15457/g.50826  ORF Transcript_15457/g.50826 Transcript_15457/m.50826 type:complete len:1003 (+) Transcript_15457:313-3321(+)
MAALLLAKLLTRPDMPKALAAFLEWGHGVLDADAERRGSAAEAPADPKAQFLIPGVASAFAAIFKLGARDALLPLAEKTWESIRTLVESPMAKESTLVRKLTAKLATRLALVFLRPRVVSWRYQRGARSLLANLSQTAAGEPASSATEEAAAEDELEEDYDVGGEVEEAIDHLLTGLRDKDTIVRWCAARGIGRITSRLPLELADEVVESILELFAPAEGDGAWHGGCLALAELARRGLLLPARLPIVIPKVTKALMYDVRKGPHSVGAHVRDSAAYVCWAFARAYAPDIMEEHAKALSPALLVAAVFDREVNCRRAASAAFQECVGRLGNFPHGIDISTAADYFAVGARPNAYLKVSVFIANFPEYTRPLLEHLLHVKLRHWEKSLRELASKALAALTPADPEFVVSEALPMLLGWMLDPDLCVRHGAALAAAEVLPALQAAGVTLPESMQAACAEAVARIEKARLYRGKGGEVMRGAVCRFIECLSAIKLPLDKKTAVGLHLSIDENLKHPTAEIQEAAARALKAFLASYRNDVVNPELLKRTVGLYGPQLKANANAAVRRGAALALGALPPSLAAGGLSDALDALCAGSAPEVEADLRDAETRVNAVRALTALARSAAAGAAFGGIPADTLSERVCGALIAALDDYCTDNRGDVGSWVREAAMGALASAVELLCHLAGADALEARPELAASVYGALVKQGAEKIDRVREAAGAALAALLRNPATAAAAPHRAALEKAVLPDGAESPAPAWAAPGTAFPAVVPLLACETYRLPLLAGLVVSVGGVGDSLGKASTAALVAHIERVRKLGGEGGGGVPDGLVETFAKFAKVDRVVVPLLRTLDALYARAALQGLEGFANAILESIKAELKGCKDIPKACLCSTVLCHLVGVAPAVRSGAVEALLGLLCNRYPRVRRSAAEGLYVTLLAEEEDDNLEPALEILSDTAWDAAVAELRPTRDKLYPFFGLIAPAPPVVDPNKPAKAKKVADENSSYSSLVQDAGY